MVTGMLIASPPVVSQTLEDEERKKEKDRETDRRKVTIFSQLKQENQLDLACKKVLLLFRKT